MHKKLSGYSVSFICLLAICLSGCVETAMKYHGRQVAPVHVVPLHEGQQAAGTWQTFDVVIDYTFLKNGEVLEMSGQVELGQSYQTTYDGLKFLDLYVFFMDKDSRVLETVYMPAFLTNTTDDKGTFTRSYNVPDGTVGVSFGYDGKVGGWDGHTRFYQLPLQKS